MGYDLKKFNSGCMDKGIQARGMDFQGDISLDISTYNMTQGLQQGLGPRYGMSAVPGQSFYQFNLPSLPQLPGLGTIEPQRRRAGVLAVYALRLPDPSDITKRVTTYAFVIVYDDSPSVIDIALTSTGTSTGSGVIESISSYIYSGFGEQSYATSTVSNYFAEAIIPDGTDRVIPLASALLYPEESAYCSTAIISVTGPNVTTGWLLGSAVTNGDATHAPNVAFAISSAIYGLTASATEIPCGVPSEYNLQNFTTGPRALKVFALKNDATLNIQYSLSLTSVTPSIFKKDIFGVNAVTLDVSTITATKDTAGTTYSSTVAALINDPLSITNASYKAILIASSSPKICLFQDAYRQNYTTLVSGGKTNQWFDPTQNTYQPRSYPSAYLEEAISQKTAFAAWPSFVRGTAMSTTYNVKLGAADSGILRKKTVYEFTFSVYNKRLNFETNVGKCVKFQTGSTDDFVGLILYTPSGTTASAYSDYRAGTVNSMFPFFVNFVDSSTGVRGYQNFLNDVQYRFYYRQEGTFEWLPALFIDAAQYWFYPGGGTIVACNGPIAALPGGQPGAFNDYSPLPKDRYSCVLQYKDRVWWFSDKAINFSLRNNIFVYPGRNSISATGGQFNGGIVHNYPGQAEQSSRLVIFGTTETYVARFTGVRQQTNVQVSANTSGIFDIDASDLVIDPWTSVTAFSYRAAAIADGILFWWGSQGVFRDDGVNTPTRISQDLEPDLFSLYDPNKTAEIFGNYNNQTKEIEWFFTPKVQTADRYTESIIYNTLSGNWTRGRYRSHIAWVQGLQIDTAIGTAGFREVVGSMQTNPPFDYATNPQSVYFFDQKNRSGDMSPANSLIVKQVSTVSPTVKRLTLTESPPAATSIDTTIAVGDMIALQQTTSYSGLAADDLIASVVARSQSARTIDITIPEGATITNGVLAYNTYFPIWHAKRDAAGLNGIPFNLATTYWIPDGVNGYFLWLFFYFLAKMRIWFNDTADGWTFSYRTPTSTGYISDFIPFEDNSDGNFQAYHPLRPGDDNMEGQGVKFTISGIHIGNEWVLQYLEAHGQPFMNQGDPLKRFEV